jgi:hypothetical protein
MGFLELFTGPKDSTPLDGESETREGATTPPTLEIERELKDRITNLNTKKSRNRKLGIVFLAGGALFVSLGIYFGLREPFTSSILIIFSACYGVLFIVTGAALFSTQALDIEIQSAEDDLDLMSVQQQSPTIRAYAAFRRHQLELRRYYNQSLLHGKIIFSVGIACIAIGFAVVGVTLYLLAKNLDADIGSKILIGSVGAIGGLLSNFIAALYLRMFSTTSESLTYQHERLIAAHFLHFGNFLATKVERNTALREKTLSAMARSLADSVSVMTNSHNGANGEAEKTPKRS